MSLHSSRYAALFLFLALPGSLSAASPFATTQPPFRLSKNASVITGMAVPNGEPSLAWFELGFRGQYEQQTAAISIGNGSSVVSISAVISNLFPNAAYQSRLVVSNAAGIAYGAPALFVSAANANAWGDNWFSQATIRQGLDDAVAIAAGEHHTLILRANGTVAGLGYNGYGQATAPPGVFGVIAVAAGNNHSVALKNNGTVIAWGCNTAHQTNVPAGLRDVTAVAAGHNHTLALRFNGLVTAWGLNDAGQTDVPPGLSNVVAIAAGA